MEQATNGARMTWHTTRAGDRCYINVKGEWVAGIVKKRGRKMVDVAFGEGRRVKRLYQELRSKI